MSCGCDIVLLASEQSELGELLYAASMSSAQPSAPRLACPENSLLPMDCRVGELFEEAMLADKAEGLRCRLRAELRSDRCLRTPRLWGFPVLLDLSAKPTTLTKGDACSAANGDREAMAVDSWNQRCLYPETLDENTLSASTNINVMTQTCNAACIGALNRAFLINLTARLPIGDHHSLRAALFAKKMAWQASENGQIACLQHIDIFSKAFD
jgi:hypothetical protein